MYRVDKPEPLPTKGDKVVLAEVMKDLKARAEMGRERYGDYLRTHNGRNALMDAYQEALDLCMYLRQALMEIEDAAPPEVEGEFPK